MHQVPGNSAIKKGTQSVFCVKQSVPCAALPFLDQKLKRLGIRGVLAPVAYSEWVTHSVFVWRVNVRIRFFADFSTGLNALPDADCYPLLLSEDILTTVSGGTCFAKVVLAKAYFRIELASKT